MTTPHTSTSLWSPETYKHQVVVADTAGGGTRKPPWNLMYGSCTLPQSPDDQAQEFTRVLVYGGAAPTTGGGLWLLRVGRTGTHAEWSALEQVFPTGTSRAVAETIHIHPMLVGIHSEWCLLLGGHTAVQTGGILVPFREVWIGRLEQTSPTTSRMVWNLVTSPLPVFSSGGAPFRFSSDSEVPSSATATFMRTSRGELVVVRPHPEDIAFGRRHLGILRLRVEKDTSGMRCTARYVILDMVKSAPAWPCNTMESLRMAPLGCGFAIGLTVPKGRSVAPRVDAKTWILGLTTYRDEWDPEDGSIRAHWYLMPEAIGGASPSLRTGMLLASTGSRFTISPTSEGTVTSVVFAYGGRNIWKSPIGLRQEDDPGMPSFSPLHVGIFTKSLRSMTFAWQHPSYRLSAPIGGGGTPSPLLFSQVGDVPLAEVFLTSTAQLPRMPRVSFPIRDENGGKRIQNVGPSGGLHFAFVFHGGSGQEPIVATGSAAPDDQYHPTTTVLVEVSLPIDAIRKATEIPPGATVEYQAGFHRFSLLS